MSGAVFLSYASQDAEAARRICEALRSAGVEVWFDAEGGLEHGDEWDGKIRRQIRECVLFIPIISANTQARHEGYFRIEWELAADRAVGIAAGVPFILPIVIDDTREPDALVPDRFRKVQWTRLPQGTVPPEVQARLLKLWSHRTGVLSHEPARALAPEVRSSAEPVGRSRALAYTSAALAFLVCAGALGWWLTGGWKTTPATQGRPPSAAPVSEARQLANRARAMSVDSYDSTVEDYTAAESLLKRALQLDPDDGEIWADSARLNLMFVNRGFDHAPARIAAGHEQAERAIRLAPDSINGLFALGFWQWYTPGNEDDAIATLRRVLVKDPDHPLAQLYLGLALVDKGQTEEGFALFERVRPNREWAPLADYLEYIIYMGKRRFAEAEQAVRRSIAAQPSANSVAGLAMLLITAPGDLNAAAQALASAPTALLPAPRIVYMTVQVQLERRAPEEALKALDRLPDDFITESSFTVPKNYLVGLAQMLAGHKEAARAAWEAALAVVDVRLKPNPTDGGLHRMRGELLACLGRTEDALAEAKVSDEFARGRSAPWTSSVARIYALLGRPDLAVPILKRLLDPRTSTGNWPLTPALLRQDPLWDKLRGDPGFQALLTENSITTAGPGAQPSRH